MNRRLLLGFVTFAVIVIVALEVPFGLTLVNGVRASKVSEVESDATSLSYLVARALAGGEGASARGVVDHFAANAHAIVAVTVGGRALLSAGAGAGEELGDPATRPILRAAEGGRISGEEGSEDPDDDLLYAAVPLVVHVPARVDASSYQRGVLLVATSAAPLHGAVRRDVERLVAFGVLLLVLAAGLGALLARSLTRPLAAIETVVAAHGRGELGRRAAEGVGPAELRAHARTVNEMAGRTEELLAAQRSFVADAAHQLRSPLTALRLRLENLVRRRTILEPSDLQAPIAEVERLSRVIDGLLALARADGSRPPLEVVDAAALLADRAAAWSALAVERDLNLELGANVRDGASRRILVEAGPGFLEQVLDNLLANAIDATPPGGSIVLEARSRGDVAELHVADTGLGMSDSDRAKAFDRFWRATSSNGEGTGLGLAIVAQLVRASGGTCRLDRSSSGGTDAVVVLPRASRGRAQHVAHAPDWT